MTESMQLFSDGEKSDEVSVYKFENLVFEIKRSEGINTWYLRVTSGNEYQETLDIRVENGNLYISYVDNNPSLFELVNYKEFFGAFAEVKLKEGPMKDLVWEVHYGASLSLLSASDRNTNRSYYKKHSDHFEVIIAGVKLLVAFNPFESSALGNQPIIIIIKI